MKTIYLAGPITGLGYDVCNDWRENAISELTGFGIIGFSPLRFTNHLSNESAMPDGDETPLGCQSGLTTRNRYDVINRDVFLANLLGAKKVSLGTMIEYGWADLASKPIITVIEPEGNPHDHAMVRELTGFRVESLEAGLYAARAILNHQ